MLKDIKKILGPAGLSDSEAGVFLATAQIGPETANKIANKAGQNRASVYDILRRLSHKGLIKQTTQRKIRQYEAVEPSIILRKLKEQKEEQIALFQQLQPELAAIYGDHYDQPSISFYEGLEGIKTILLDIFDTPNVTENIAYASADYLSAGFDKKFLEKYWQKRVALRIPARGIMPATSAAESLFTEEKNIKELRRVKFVPADKYKFTNEIDIYGDKIAIISLDKDNLYGVIIKSKSIADTQRNIYELLWSLL
ncbi:hypothetical protein KKE14_02945 [Patescibacteria group bacterium]|nr:hypothetical protein [Patescibacteria group bacterium]